MELEREQPGRKLTVEERISERIRSFDVPALLDLLAKEGYGDAEVEFKSHRSTVSQQHLVHAIEFTRQPRKRVVITVNLGLLSVQTPLPSFLFQAMDRLEHDAMADFLGYFDHLLLRTRFAGQFPDRDESLLPGWEHSTAHRLRLLRLACPSSLHWLFAKVFPEAEVVVRRETRRQRIESKGIRLGAAALGDGSAVGGFATVPTGGVEVRLFLNEPFSGAGIPWAVEARRRLNARIFPSLAETPLALAVILALRDQSSHARLQDGSHLGYEPLVGGPEQTQEVLLFSGDTAQLRSAEPR
ncbi:hypothetical protein [Corallococcus sicarius]|uniref:Type VI secretion system baseplate subunit TssG n=1 Tax=Corallococcus sicarius TaxID=2316726 RepID=A0A3A8NH32_9BACT|nr:hypothetical protein [Corallococcus sicarius]RKH40465.1 hypothetical protein D7X12_20805 [Corallococcus sicarius]